MVRVRHWHLDGSGCKYVCQDDKCKLPHLSVLEINCHQKENPVDIKRCKNCKHWQNDVATYHNGEKFQHPYGECKRIKMQFEIGDYLADPENVLDEEPAFVEDGSDYHAALRPGPEFGCVLWEVKE